MDFFLLFEKNLIMSIIIVAFHLDHFLLFFRKLSLKTYPKIIDVIKN